MQNLRERSDTLRAHAPSFSCNSATNKSAGANHNGSWADPSMIAPHLSKSTHDSRDLSHGRNHAYITDDSDSDDFESVGSSTPDHEFQSRPSSGKTLKEHRRSNISDKIKNKDLKGSSFTRKSGNDDVRLRKNPIITNKGPGNSAKNNFLSPNAVNKDNKTQIENESEEECEFNTQNSGELQDESNIDKVFQPLEIRSHSQSGEYLKNNGHHDDDSLNHNTNVRNKAQLNKVKPRRKTDVEFDEGDGGGLPATKVSLTGVQSDNNNKATHKARKLEYEECDARVCDNSDVHTSRDYKNHKDFQTLHNNERFEDKCDEDLRDEFLSHSDKKMTFNNKFKTNNCKKTHQFLSHKSKGSESKDHINESQNQDYLFDKVHKRTPKVTFEKDGSLSKKNDAKDIRTFDEGDGGGYPEDSSFYNDHCGHRDDYYNHGDNESRNPNSNSYRNRFDHKYGENSNSGDRYGLKNQYTNRIRGNNRNGKQNQSRVMNARLRRENHFEAINDHDHHDNLRHGSASSASCSCSCSSITSEESFRRSAHRVRPRCKSSGRKCKRNYKASGTYHGNRQDLDYQQQSRQISQENSRCVSPCSSQQSVSQCSSVGNGLSALSVNKPYPASWRTFGRKPPGILEFRPLGVGRLANVRPAGKQQYLSRVSDEKGGCHRKGSQSDLWDICYGLAKPITDEWTTPLPYGTNVVRVGEIDPFFQASRGDIVIINPAQNFYRAMKSGYVITYRGGQDYSFGVGDLIVRLGRFMPSGKYVPYGNLELYMHTHSREKRLLGRQPHLHVDFNYHNLDYESPGKYMAIGTFLNELLVPRRGDIIIGGGAWAENYPNEHQRKHHSSVQYWRPNSIDFLPNDMLLRPYVDIGRATRHRAFYWGAAELYSYSGKGLGWAYWGRDHHICDTPYPREQEHGIKTGYHKDEVGHCSSSK